MLFIIVPYISTLSFYYLFFIIEKFQTNKILTYLSHWGDISFEAFLIHTLFVWYLPYFVIQILDTKGIIFNHTILYFLMIIPMLIFTYLGAKEIREIITRIQKIFKTILLK